MRTLVLTAMMILISAGCATTGNPKLMDAEVTDQIRVGEATTETVHDLLGEPTGVVDRQADGSHIRIWSYGYGSAQMNPWLLVPGIGLIAVLCCDTFWAESRTLTLEFDSDGILRGRSWAKTDTTAGAGSR